MVLAMHPTVRPHPTIRAMRAPRILLADDNAEMRSLLKTSLSADGYVVIEAASGIEAAQALREALT